jgi:arylsulfatase A-like enzyme
MAGSPPCFLVFVADQLRADHLGCYGSPVPATPAIDALAGRSALCERAYVASPICMPNRATIATGRWPSAHGTRTNGITLDWDAATFMRALRDAGWATAAVGKLHFQTMGWPFEPEQHEEIERTAPLLMDPSVPDAARRERPEGWDRYEDAARHRAGLVALPSDYYGFEAVDLVVGHSDKATGHYTHWARERGLDPESRSGWERAAERSSVWEEVYRTEVPAALYPTSYVTERAIARLEQFARDTRPFLLFCSYPDPHHPFSPPAGYWERFAPADMPLPATFADPHDGSPPHVRAMIAARGRPAADPTMTWAPTEAQLREARAAEAGMLAMLDDSVAAILGALARLGLAERTTVAFTSDHGDLFGDHGLMLKHFVHYDGVLRVPLLLHVPALDGGGGRRHTGLVSSADLPATLLDLAGVTGFRGLQGRSLRPLLEGRAKSGRQRILVEEDQPFGTPGLPGPVRMRTVITDDARLTVYGERPFGELYDRAPDPDELVNRYDDPRATGLRARMYEELAGALMEVAETGVAPVAGA